MKESQERVAEWVRETFGPVVAKDRQERALRVLEEATELVQAEGIAFSQVVVLALRTYARPVGDAAQEAAGIGVTLLAWGAAAGVDVEAMVDAELDRIERPGTREAIRAKQTEKQRDGITSVKASDLR